MVKTISASSNLSKKKTIRLKVKQQCPASEENKNYIEQSLLKEGESYKLKYADFMNGISK